MYICTKAVKLSGDYYFPGDNIPEEAVLPTRVGKLIACGIISKPADTKSTEKKAGSRLEEKAAAKAEPKQSRDIKPEAKTGTDEAATKSDETEIKKEASKSKAKREAAQAEKKESEV